MKKSKLPKQALIILSIALVLVISTVMWSSAQITQDTEEEVQSTLRDVATQNALIVQQELRENFNLLYSLKLINAIYFLIIFIIFCYNASHLVTDNPVFIA
jgi:type II secretory pathway pseudopilin PulG